MNCWLLPNYMNANSVWEDNSAVIHSTWNGDQFHFVGELPNNWENGLDPEKFNNASFKKKKKKGGGCWCKTKFNILTAK